MKKIRKENEAMKKRLGKIGLIVCGLLICLGLLAIAGKDPFAAMTGLWLLPAFGMAVTTQKSTQETNRTATPVTPAEAYDYHGKLRFAYFSFTQSGAGDANSLANLVTLPPGKVRLLKTKSEFVCSAFGAARTLDIGYLAHTKLDGTAVNASIDTILDGGDVSAAAKLICGAGTNALGTDPTILFDSKEGVTIQAKCLGDTLPDAATLKGFMAYVVE